MDTDFHELRTQRYLKEIEAKEVEIEFGRLKIEELTRQIRDARVSPAESHIMTFAAPIGSDEVQAAIRTLGMWAREDPGGEITIILNSPGGEVLSGLALYDYIEELKKQGHTVHIKVIGSAMSMAAVLLQAGSTRTISPNSWIMIHEVSSEIGGNMTQMRERQLMVSRWQESMLNILAERSGMTKTAIKRKWGNKDWLLDAKEALKLGFVDAIG